MISKNVINLPPADRTWSPKHWSEYKDTHHFLGYKESGGILEHICHCREVYERRIQSYYRANDYRWLGYHTSKKFDLKRINRFWGMIERRLGIKSKTVFYRNNQFPNIIIIKVNPFWIKDATKSAIYTLLMRFAFDHYQGDWYEDIKTYPLMYHSRDAVYRFLAGYTEGHWGPQPGTEDSHAMEGYFCACFQFANQEMLEEGLRKPILK